MGFQDDFADRMRRELAAAASYQGDGDDGPVQAEPVDAPLVDEDCASSPCPSTSSGRTEEEADPLTSSGRAGDGDHGDDTRHPELGSVSHEDRAQSPEILNQVQDDGVGDDLPPSCSQEGDEAGPSTGRRCETARGAVSKASGRTDIDDASKPPLSLPPDYRPRAGGWSKRKMVDFLEALAATCSVEEAAQTVSMSRSAAYRLRARLAGTPFDLAWEAALENGLRQVAHSALDRAVNGVMQPVFYKGEQVGERRVFNERLTWLLLTHADKIGRSPLAREHGLYDWDGLLDRVEKGNLDWEQPMIDAAHSDATDAEAKEYFRNKSDYGARWIRDQAIADDRKRR